MIDWYFAKLGPVIGLALIVSVVLMLVAAGLSVLVGGLDRDETEQRGFPIDLPREPRPESKENPQPPMNTDSHR